MPSFSKSDCVKRIGDNYIISRACAYYINDRFVITDIPSYKGARANSYKLRLSAAQRASLLRGNRRLRDHALQMDPSQMAALLSADSMHRRRSQSMRRYRSEMPSSYQPRRFKPNPVTLIQGPIVVNGSLVGISPETKREVVQKPLYRPKPKKRVTRAKRLSPHLPQKSAALIIPMDVVRDAPQIVLVRRGGDGTKRLKASVVSRDSESLQRFRREAAKSKRYRAPTATPFSAVPAKVRQKVKKEALSDIIADTQDGVGSSTKEANQAKEGGESGGFDFPDL